MNSNYCTILKKGVFHIFEKNFKFVCLVYRILQLFYAVSSQTSITM